MGNIGDRIMRLLVRFIVYLGGGGLILIWVEPPRGVGMHLLILALVVGFAYLDRWLFRIGAAPSDEGNVVSLNAARQSRNQRQGQGGAVRERKIFQTVYTSGLYHEVETLLSLLRAEGFNPMMISQRTAKGESEAVYQVRLPEKELARARPLIQFFLVKSAKHPS